MIQKLKFHLSGLNLDLREDWEETGVKNCFCVRLRSGKIPFQWKGLGTTKNEALENAYLNLAAQLQSGSWYTGRQDPELAGSSGFRVAPDEKYRTAEEMLRMHPRWYHAFYECMMKKSRRYYSEEQMWEILAKEADPGGNGSFITLSFQNQDTGAAEEVPLSVLDNYYGRDTVFAGETEEEACIRGLSRLIMRHHMIRIHETCITPPDIPEELISSYDSVREIVEDIRSRPGYILKLKDCSLERDFPVVAALLISQKSGGYLVTFGANPSMRKAMEECLTALFSENRLFGGAGAERIIFDERELGKIDMLQNILAHFQGEYHYSFFLSDPSYSFHGKTVYEPRSPDDSYQRCMDYFSGQGYEVYRRDISALGCSGVRLFVPSFSENGYELELKMKESISHYRATRTLDCLGTADMKEIKSLWIFLQYKESFETENGLSYLVQLPLELKNDRKRYYYIVLLVCLLQKMYQEAGKILRRLISFSDSVSEYRYFSCMRMLLSLTEYDYEETEHRVLLEKFFPPETVWKVEESFSNQSSLAAMLGFSCSQFRCQECNHTSVCRYQEVREIQIRLKQKLLQQRSYTYREKEEEETAMSQREAEVVSRYLNGLSRKEIATELVISENTVKKHMSNVFKKTGAKSRAELYEYMKKRVC